MAVGTIADFAVQVRMRPVLSNRQFLDSVHILVKSSLMK